MIGYTASAYEAKELGKGDVQVKIGSDQENICVSTGSAFRLALGLI